MVTKSKRRTKQAVIREEKIPAPEMTETVVFPEEEKRQDQEPVPGSLEELLVHADKAYASYVEAKQQVITSYKDKESQFNKLHNIALHQAQYSCDEAVARAMKAREENLTQAMKDYNETLRHAKEKLAKAQEEADRVCQENLEQALGKRNEAIDTACQEHDISIKQAWKALSKLGH